MCNSRVWRCPSHQPDLKFVCTSHIQCSHHTAPPSSLTVPCAHVAGGTPTTRASNSPLMPSMEALPQAAAQDRGYRLMKEAVDEAYRAVDSGDGDPFGAVIVRDDAVLVSCHNLLRKNTDPSAHAEVTAIRQACKMLGKLDLSDYEIYSSCEPCPMCFALIRASKIKKVVYGATAEAAVAAGLDASIPEAFVEYYRKSGIEIRQVQGEAARIAEEVFEKAWEIPDEAMRRGRTEHGGWFVKAKGMVTRCLWN